MAARSRRRQEGYRARMRRRRRLRPFRLGLWLGLAAGAAWFVQRFQRSRQELAAVDASGWSVVEPVPETPTPRLAAEPIPDVPVVPVVEPEVVEVGDLPQPSAEPPIEPVADETVKKAAKKKAAAKKAAPVALAPWVAPDPGGICPTSHPVKAKLASKLFHLPGMFAYTRTNPDRCYLDESAAEADGLRKAKR